MESSPIWKRTTAQEEAWEGVVTRKRKLAPGGSSTTRRGLQGRCEGKRALVPELVNKDSTSETRERHS